MINFFTDSRTVAVKCIQSKNCLGNMTDMSMDSVGPTNAKRVPIIIMRWG